MDTSQVRILPKLDISAGHNFTKPSKRINESQDVAEFLSSKAYVDLMTFLLQLNRSLFPTKLPDGRVLTWELNSEAVEYSAPVRQLQQLLSKLEAILDEAPPDTGPRRFGNISFRRWYEIVESRAASLLEECLSKEILQMPSSDPGAPTAEVELLAYFLGSWGSPQRLDYGTGHELSFLAFLAGIWKLHGFPENSPGVEERAIVLGVIQPWVSFKHSCWTIETERSLPQISRTCPNHYKALYPGTRRFARCLGSRRPLIHPIHLRLRTIGTRNLRIRPHPGRRLVIRRPCTRWCH